MSERPVAIVTGASRGIGRAVALYFAKQGYDVALIAQNQQALESLEQEIMALDNGVKTKGFALDVSQLSEVEAAVSRIMAGHGRIDVLFNSAGIAYGGNANIAPEQFDRLFQVNVTGTYNMIHSIVPIMQQQKSGYIMNLSSTAGLRAVPSAGAYSASKFAITGYSESLLKELSADNIKVTAICPSVTNTDMTQSFDIPNEIKLSVDDLVTTVDYLLKLGPNAVVKSIAVYCMAMAQTF